jgi:hypothetical protein
MSAAAPPLVSLTEIRRMARRSVAFTAFDIDDVDVNVFPRQMPRDNDQKRRTINASENLPK